ncbi:MULTISPECIES: cytochrome P450 [unclassified Mycolicibacterium]|uniref:cytochrome P450 n=1 Tax=unclassified Mycolicibacterium TaxID=2636767 RepID=UPI0012DC8AB8|nr:MULTISPECIES: cytochrome P450 [unclassified Mycolicibacterium]MUL85120.1 cytochrome P450 [Mycolicibacterium sp. CBMA 329]MUL91087.1 cytochrome P450 [Mycolicibacterium sp. CBMA 331]MUL98242.1 cytochrome P450 [Mycolicibacterium sp. CBMA 334]MUM26121.1 cytochrome P450 [Mycolicibacterium sp. CBMA 295]MUM40846.1 cytochrome P450 [Mycolicibacterium sp. CBMA 247]
MLPAHELFEPACLQDPYPLYDRLLAGAPVAQVGDSPFFVVSSFDAVTEATARPQDFSSNLTATMWYQPDGTVSAFGMGEPGSPIHVLATADDPAHAAHRKMVLSRMAAKRIAELEPFIAVTTADLLTGAAEEFDWMSTLADRLPMLVVAKLLGLPAADVDRLVTWAYASTQLLDGLVDTEQLTASGIAAVELGGYLTERFGEALANPDENLLGDLATYCTAERLSRDVAVFMLIQLIGAGAESTAALIGSAVWILSRRPELTERLQRDPAMITPFLEEVLRFESPFRGHYRHVLADTELAGVAVPADSHLLLLWGAANRDEGAFEAPHKFRLDRPNIKNHLAFGKGGHFCLGAALARLEARIVVPSLLSSGRTIRPAGHAEWLPSLLVRRLRQLPLSVR